MATSMVPTLLIQSDGTAQTDDYTATRPFRIYDIHTLCVTLDGASTTTVQRQALGAGAFNAISSAISDNVAAGIRTQTASIANAQAVFVATDVLRFAGSGAGRQRGYVAIIPTAITV